MRFDRDEELHKAGYKDCKQIEDFGGLSPGTASGADEVRRQASRAICPLFGSQGLYIKGSFFCGLTLVLHFFASNFPILSFVRSVVDFLSFACVIPSFLAIFCPSSVNAPPCLGSGIGPEC